jgi:hypothetical protein
MWHSVKLNLPSILKDFLLSAWSAEVGTSSLDKKSCGHLKKKILLQ